MSSLALGARLPSPRRTMRVDYYHTGNDKEERFSLDRVVVEPLPWPGNPARPIDTTNRGKYFFEVVDAATGTVLYSRGFSSIYGEWETTAEAQDDEPDVLGVAAISRASTSRRASSSRSATRGTSSASLDRHGRSGGQVHRARRAARRRRAR